MTEEHKRLIRELRELNADRFQLIAEDGGWLATVAGAPVAAEGDDPTEAIDELIDALREYSADWSERLRLAPNHRDNWGLVQLVDHSTDDELRGWILGD